MPKTELRSRLKEHMQYCMDHPDEISRLAKVQAQVSEVKGVMMENIVMVRVFNTNFTLWMNIKLFILACFWLVRTISLISVRL